MSLTTNPELQLQLQRERFQILARQAADYRLSRSSSLDDKARTGRWPRIGRRNKAARVSLAS